MGVVKNNYVRGGIGIAVTLGCLWLALPGADLASKSQGIASTARILQGAAYGWLLPLVLLLGVFYLTKAYRWALLLQPIFPCRTRQVLPATMIGFTGNIILPARLGDLLRIYVLSKRYRLSKAAVFSTVFLERLLDAIATTVLFALAGLWLDLPDWYVTGGIVGAVCVFFILIGLILYVHHTRKALRFWMGHFKFLPPRFHHALADIIANGAKGLSLLRHSKRFAFTVLLSIGHWSLLGMYIYIVFGAFSLDLPFSAALLVLSGTMVTLMVPSSPGFWGVVQVVFIVALEPHGVAQDAALAASFYYMASQYVPIVLAGLLFMARMGFSIREIKAQALTFGGDK